MKVSSNTHAVNDKLTQLQQTELNTLLSEFADIFQDTPGKTNMCKHQITLVPGFKPVASTPYRLHPERATLVEQEIDQMLKMGIITRSDSPWASPIVVVPKTDGSIRLCVNYRKVNSMSVPDPFPLPRVEDLVDKVGQAKYLTKIDMTRGYWQVPLDELLVPISAFVTPTWHFQWQYMPFGLRNAPATFSRLVSQLLKRLEYCSVAYLDDIIIFSNSWEEHLKYIKLVFNRIREAGLTLNKNKCVFATGEVDYLGHHVGLGKVEPLQKKLTLFLIFLDPQRENNCNLFSNWQITIGRLFRILLHCP